MRPGPRRLRREPGTVVVGLTAANRRHDPGDGVVTPLSKGIGILGALATNPATVHRASPVPEIGPHDSTGLEQQRTFMLTAASSDRHRRR